MDGRIPVRLLVADDDPVSLQFLVAALRELGAEVDAAADGRAALAACERSPFDMLLLDRRMPDIGGAALLRELRRRGCASVAIATSAELDPSMRSELGAAGYADAVTKPLGIERLGGLLAAHLPQWRSVRNMQAEVSPEESSPALVKSALLEDGPALASTGGDERTLRALRELFAKELETVLPRIVAMSPNDLGEWLHRLRASCRYCGAMRLGEAAEQLQTRLKSSLARPADELTAFSGLCRQTLETLSQRGGD